MRCSAPTACGRATPCSPSPRRGCTRTASPSCAASSRTRGLAFTDRLDDLGGPLGETLLTPTRLYTAELLELLRSTDGAAVHALSHVTGGGIAANLARVLPDGTAVELERGTWRPAPVFRVLADLGGLALPDVEGTWNLGIGMLAVVAPESAAAVLSASPSLGVPTWTVGTVDRGRDAVEGASAEDGWVRGAKGVDGGAVRLSGAYAA